MSSKPSNEKRRGARATSPPNGSTWNLPSENQPSGKNTASSSNPEASKNDTNRSESKPDNSTPQVSVSPPQTAEMERELYRRLWLEFLPYQQRYVKDKSRFVLVEKAVRTGFTYAHAFKSMTKRAFKRLDPRTGAPIPTPSREIFVSKNLKTALDYMDYHRRWARAFNAIFGSQVINIGSWTTEVARYPYGTVEIYSSDPDAFRGLRGDVTLDEFAFHERQEQLYATAQGRIMWEPDGQVSLISSHSHPETLFYQIASEAKAGRNRFSVHSVTIEEAVMQGLAMKVPGPHLAHYVPSDPASILAVGKAFLEDVRAQCIDDDQYMREYMCEPTGLGSLVSGVEYDRLYLYESDGDQNAPLNVPDTIPPDVTGELYVGVDVGRTHDLTVIWVLERGYDGNRPQGQEDVFRTCAVRAMRNMSFEEQRLIIRSFLSHPLIQACHIDAGGIGFSLSESLREEFGGLIEQHHIGAKKKAELCERVKRFVQQERVSMPYNSDIRADILAMRKHVTERGGVRYDGRTNKTHCDYFMALSLALNAANSDLRLDIAGRAALPQLQ